MRELLAGNYAIAEAVRLAKAQLIPAYPITPQTPIYEKLSEMEAQGILPGTMVRVESEHSAMAMCISASLTGARVFTATSSGIGAHARNAPLCVRQQGARCHGVCEQSPCRTMVFWE